MENSGNNFNNSYRHRGTECPTCKNNLDCSTGGDQLPEKGDYSICAYCGEILRYNDNIILSLEKPTSDELDKLLIDAPETYINLLKFKVIIRNRNTSLFNQHKK